jgi:hypothetical protein
LPRPNSATIASLSSNNGSTDIIVTDVGAPRLVVVKNANTGIVVASNYISSGTDNALLDVSSQSSPFRGEISVHSRSNDMAVWASKVFDKIYQGDSFTIIPETRWKPPVVRGYTTGYRNRSRGLLKHSTFARDIARGDDIEYFTDG